MRFSARWLVVALFGLTSSVAQAQVCPFVVDPSGSDPSTTHVDLQQAVDDYQTHLNGTGCTIHVLPGIYTDSIELNGVLGASDSQRLVIAADAGAVFNTARRDAVKIKNSQYVTIVGFEILTGTNKPIAIEGGNAANLGITVEDIDFHDNGGGRDSGCVFVGDDNVNTWIINNVCWNNGSDGIVLGKGGPNYVVNNTVFDNEKDGIQVRSDAIAVVANNLVLFNGIDSGGAHFGIDVQSKGQGGPTGVQVFGNVSYGNDPAGGDIGGISPAGNATTATLGGGLSANDFIEDPLLPDFHLAAGSPAIGAGAATTGTSPERVPPIDFDGDTRLAPIDAGADEVTDSDFDGAPDLGDNCPSEPNPAQEDHDGDGIGDHCDNCPDDANPLQTDDIGFDAAGNQQQGPNGRGDVCEGVGESLFQPSPGPLAGAVFVTTFLAIEETTTVTPDCFTTYFFCVDQATGERVPRVHRLVSRGIPDSLQTFAPGELVTNACPVLDLFEPGVLPDGQYLCKACYDNEHEDLDLAPDGSCSDPPCVDNFTGMVCSQPAPLSVDSTVGREGCSPGSWKNKLHHWPATGLSPDDSFEQVFGIDLFAGDPTLLDALSATGGDEFALGRHATAALLSALHPEVDFPYSEDAVRALVTTSTDVTETTNLLSEANNLSCPLSGSTP